MMLRQNSADIADAVGLTTTKLHVEKTATAALQQEEFQIECLAKEAIQLTSLHEFPSYR